MSANFEELISKVKEYGKKKVSVAVAEDAPILEAVEEARKQGFADAILVGDEAKIREIAAGLNIDLTPYEIINEPDHWQAALKAVKLAHDGVADMYMKGLIDTKSFLKSILDKEVGLRTGKPLSHVCCFEVVNPKMPVTVEAAELTKMNEEGKITGCIVDGPLSMDLAIDPEAAKHKGATDRKIQGDADILLFPDIHAGNLVYKTLVHTAEVKNGCILTGTQVPAILTSRSDTFQTKVNSIALAAVVAEGLKKNK